MSTTIKWGLQTTALWEAQQRIKDLAPQRGIDGHVGYLRTDLGSDDSQAGPRIVCVGEHVTAAFTGEARYEHATEWLNMLVDKWEAEANA